MFRWLYHLLIGLSRRQSWCLATGLGRTVLIGVLVMGTGVLAAITHNLITGDSWLQMPQLVCRFVTGQDEEDAMDALLLIACWLVCVTAFGIGFAWAALKFRSTGGPDQPDKNED